MNILAIIYLTCVLFSLLPGSVYKGKPEVDWGNPHVYVAILSLLAGVSLAILVLV
jgi:hypothetical protein